MFGIKQTYGLSPERIIFVYFVFLDVQLLNNTLFEVLFKIGADFHCSILGGYLRHVGLDHEADEVFKARLVGVPAKLRLGFCGIAPKVDDISWAVEIRGDSYYDVSS